MPHTGGRPTDPRRLHYATQYGIKLTAKQVAQLSQSFMDQLDRCKTDEARRILLGVSR